MKIAGIQHDIIWENPEANFSNLQPMINEAAEKEVELIVLSELFSTLQMLTLTYFALRSTIHAHTSSSPSVTFVTGNFHAHSAGDVMRFVFFFSISNRFSFLFLKLKLRKLEISI